MPGPPAEGGAGLLPCVGRLSPGAGAGDGGRLAAATVLWPSTELGPRNRPKGRCSCCLVSLLPRGIPVCGHAGPAQGQDMCLRHPCATPAIAAASPTGAPEGAGNGRTDQTPVMLAIATGEEERVTDEDACS